MQDRQSDLIHVITLTNTCCQILGDDIVQLFVFLYLFIVVYLTNCIVLSDVGSDTTINFDMAFVW